MGKVVLYMFMSLDGFIAGPNGEFDAFYPSDEEIAFGNRSFFSSVDGFMFGRMIYQDFIAYWDTLDLSDPTITPANREFARIFSEKHRVVFSNTLDAVTDNATLLRDYLTHGVAALKQRFERDFALICGPDLLSTLIGLGLVNECRIMVMPTALGRGKALFGSLTTATKLTLLTTKAFASGTVLHHYQIDNA